MKKIMNEVLGYTIIGLFIFCMILPMFLWKQWQYNECINVGYSKSYCTAKSAGCFNK